eukprot:scaffold226721_cov50-Prasinocladus_malaysianus.AAC.1
MPYTLCDTTNQPQLNLESYSEARGCCRYGQRKGFFLVDRADLQKSSKINVLSDRWRWHVCS